MRRKIKILIIGAKGYQTQTEESVVSCYSWKDATKIVNIRDFDTIIINLLNHHDFVWQDDSTKLLNVSLTYDVIKNNGRFIIIGDPRFNVRIGKDDVPFLDWTGLKFFWDDSPGDTIDYKDDYKHTQYEGYIKYFSKWEYSLSGCKIDNTIVDPLFNIDDLKKNQFKIDFEIDQFCANRYRNGLAFSINVGIFSMFGGQQPYLFGQLLFLPKINKSDDETIRIILKDLCGIVAKLPEPEWVKEFKAPGQDEIDKKIEQLELNIRTGFNELNKAQEEKEKNRTCLKLLYEREYALEPATREVFRALGAHVEDPKEPNKEDGWIAVQIGENTYEGVLEIKSTRADQFSEDGRKQLLDWIDHGRMDRSKDYKGIFVGNSAVDKPLKERPYAFSDSWQKNAKLSKICAIKTETLYMIFLLKCDNKIDIDKFWKMLFETNGIFDVKSFLT